MSMSDELARLAELHQRGALSDDEFTRAKARVLGAGAPARAADAVADAARSLQRSSHDRLLGGVCGGLAEVTSLPSWAWRLLFVLLSLVACVGVLVYALMWVLVPRAPQPPAVAAAG